MAGFGLKELRLGRISLFSPRSLQYCSNAYQQSLKTKKMTPSITENYAPYVNAIAERVNRILKQEFLLEEYQVQIKTMQQLVKEAVERYNTKKTGIGLVI